MTVVSVESGHPFGPSISDERLIALIEDAQQQHHESQDSPHYAALSRDTALALRELQQWRSGIHPQTGAIAGSLTVAEPWTEETE